MKRGEEVLTEVYRRDHREMCITEEVLRQKRSSKDVTSHGCRSAGMRTDFFIARNSCHVA